MTKVRLQCPGCKTALAKETVRPDKVYTCPKCGHAITPPPLRPPAAVPVARPAPAVPVAIPTPVAPMRARSRASCGKLLLVGVLMLLLGAAVGGGGTYGLLLVRQKARAPQPVARGDEGTVPQPTPSPTPPAVPPTPPADTGPDSPPPAPKPADPTTSVVATPAPAALDLSAPAELQGHKGKVAYLEFSPDGAHLVSVSTAGDALLWDLATGRSTTLVSENAVRMARFAADGKTVIAGSKEQAGTWDVCTTLGKATFPGEMATVGPGGRALVTQTRDASGYHFHVWDANAAREVLIFDDKNGGRLAVSPDGKTVALGAGKDVRLFNAGAGTERERIQGLRGDVQELVFAPDSSVLACVEGSYGLPGISLWGVADATAKPRLDYRVDGDTRLKEDLTFHDPRSPRFTPDGRTLAFGAGATDLVLWDVAARQARAVVPASAPADCAADGKTFAALAKDGARFLVADAVSGTVRTVVDVEQSHRGRGTLDAWYAVKALSPDGRFLAYGTSEGPVELRPVTGGSAGGVKELASMPFPEGELPFGKEPGAALLVFSPDGRFLAASAARNWSVASVAVWDVAGGKPLGQIQSRNAWAFLPGGQGLFTQQLDGSAIKETYVSLRGGRPQQTVVKAIRFYGLQLSPDGRTMAACLSRAVTGKDEQVALLNAANAQLIAVLADGQPERFAFSPDSKLLASTDSGYKVKLWDVTSRAARPTNAEHARDALAFGDNGRVLATVDDERLYVYDVETGQLKNEVELRRGHSGRVFGVALSPVAPLFASVGETGEALVRDLADGRLRARLPAQGGTAAAAAFSPDGKVLATACLDRTLKLWDVGDLPAAGADTAGPAKPRPPVAPAGPPAAGPPQPREYAEFPCEQPGQWGYLRFSRDGSRVAVGYGKVQLWDLAAKAQLLPAAGKPGVYWPSEQYSCLAPDGRTVLHGGRDSLAAFDVATGTLHPLPLDGSWYGTAVFSPDGKFLAVGQEVKGKEGKVLTVFDLTTYSEKAALTAFDASVKGVGCTPDGSELFAILADREGSRLLRLDPDTLKQRTDLGKLYRHDWNTLVFSPDSKLVGFYAEPPRNLPSSAPTPLTLWDIAAGRPRTAVKGGGNICCFVAGGALFANGSYGSVTLSDVHTGQARKQVALLDDMKKETGHERDANYGPGSYDVAFSADGRWVAAGARSGHVYFWELPGGQLVAKFKAHAGSVSGLAFSPDGRFLVTVGEERKLKVWTMDGAAPTAR